MITKEYKNLPYFINKLYSSNYHIMNLTIKINDSLYPVFDPELVYDSNKKAYLTFSRLFVQEALALELSEDPTGLITLTKEVNQEDELVKKHALKYTVTLQQTPPSFVVFQLTELDSYIVSFDIGELKFILLLYKQETPILLDLLTDNINPKKIREVTLLLELGLLGKIDSINFSTSLGSNFVNFNYVDYYTLLRFSAKNKYNKINDIGLNLNLANVSLNLKLPKSLTVAVSSLAETNKKTDNSNSEDNKNYELGNMFLKYEISKTSTITFLVNRFK